MGFKVPDDLADKDLTLTQVRTILDNRKTIKRVEARLAALPDKAKAYKSELADLRKVEADLMADVKDVPKAADAAPATKLPGTPKAAAASK